MSRQAKRMKITARSIPMWSIPALAFTVEMGLCAVLAAAILDVFVRRPVRDGGSITTLLPGFAYAAATVMKVCLVAALISVAAVWVRVAVRHVTGAGSANKSSRPCPHLPVCGIVAVALPPLAPLVGALSVVAAQRFAYGSNAALASHFPPLARGAVFVMLAILLAGSVAAATSLVRRERPAALSVLGLATNTALLCLFWYFRFHALGFDQDLWAPR